MSTKRTKMDFTNQHFFVGIDVHKKNWTVSVMNNNLFLSTYVMDPDPEILIKHLQTLYPGGQYHSVYEAGFSGFNADRLLRKGGIDNIIVNPAYVPRSSQELLRKTDKVDSRKLARELSNGSLQPYKMYIPTIQEESFRSLCRLRSQRTRDKIRIKAQIKSLLDFVGIKLPPSVGAANWTIKFIDYLTRLPLADEPSTQTLHLSVEYLQMVKQHIRDINMQIKASVYQDEERLRIIKLLCSIPGIGFTTATTIYAELMNIERFVSVEKLCCYVGLTPDTRSSGDKNNVLGISVLHLRYLRNMLLESAWMAVRKDPVLTECYGKYITRMSKQEAIVKIAVKLLRRIAYVWKQNKEYVFAVVA